MKKFLMNHGEKAALGLALLLSAIVLMAASGRDESGVQAIVGRIDAESGKPHGAAPAVPNYTAEALGPWLDVSDVYVGDDRETFFRPTPKIEIIDPPPPPPKGKRPLARMAPPAVDESGVTLTWSLTQGKAAQFVVERRCGDAWEVIATVAATKHRDTEIKPKRAYEYRVTPKDGDPSPVAAVTTLPLWKIRILSAAPGIVYFEIERFANGRWTRSRTLCETGKPIGKTGSTLERCAPVTKKIARLRCDKGVRVTHSPLREELPWSGIEIVYSDPDDGRTVRILRDDPAEMAIYRNALCPIHQVEWILEKLKR